MKRYNYRKGRAGNAVLCKFKNSLKSVKKTGFFWVFLKLLYLVLVSKELFFLSSIPDDFYIQMCFLTVLWGHQEGRKDITLFPSGLIYDFCQQVTKHCFKWGRSWVCPFSFPCILWGNQILVQKDEGRKETSWVISVWLLILHFSNFFL